MSKRIFYECDRCGKSQETGNLPHGWAQIQKLSELGGIDSRGDRIWCKQCWDDISQRLPEVAK